MIYFHAKLDYCVNTDNAIVTCSLTQWSLILVFEQGWARIPPVKKKEHEIKMVAEIKANLKCVKNRFSLNFLCSWVMKTQFWTVVHTEDTSSTLTLTQ
jgi:hypothetical protein